MTSPMVQLFSPRILGLFLNINFHSIPSFFQRRLRLSLIMFTSSGERKTIIFSDSRSMLDAVTSFFIKSLII